MRQADGSDLLGANNARNASIAIIYVAPGDDRPSVLEAILMQDKLGRKQIAVVLPENSRAFQRPVDFDGLKNMRRGLKAEIIFVASGVPGPAEFARARRFTVYTSLDSYTSALRAESPDNGNAKKGLLPFNRKPKLVPNANAPAFDEPASPPPQPLEAPIMPVNRPSPMTTVPSADDAWVKPSPASQQDAGPYFAPVVPMPEDEDAKPVRPRSRTGPIPIPISLSQTGAATKPLVPGAKGVNGAASPPARSGNTGKQAAIGAGVVGAGATAAFTATNRAPVAGGGQPPTRGNTSGTGGGGGGGRPRHRSTRQLLAILLALLTLLLLAGIAFASPMGQFSIYKLDEKSAITLIFGLLIIVFLIIFLVSFSFRGKPKADAMLQDIIPPKRTASSPGRVSSPPQNVSTQPQRPEKAKIEDQTNTVQQPGKPLITPIISKPAADQPKRRIDESESTQQGLDHSQNSHQAARKIPITPDAVIKLPNTPPSAHQADKTGQKESHINPLPPVPDIPSNKTMKIFYCYAREDEELLNKLKAHLRPLVREGHITMWYDRNISAGADWKQQINNSLEEADIVLLLMSSDFINSDYCYSIEMKRAMELRSHNIVEVIPIILRHVHWKIGTLSELQALPKDGKPVISSSWHNQDEAFFDIVEGIRKVVDEKLKTRQKQ